MNGKQTILHSYRGILLSSQKEWTTDTNNTDESQMHCAKWRKPYLEKKKRERERELFWNLLRWAPSGKTGSERLNALWRHQGSTINGPTTKHTAGKKSQYSKWDEDAGKTRPFSPCTLGNPAAKSGDQVGQQLTAATRLFSAAVNSTQIDPADKPRTRTLPWLYPVTYCGQ